MDQTLFDQNGRPVAYIHSDFHCSVYLWDGSPVAHLDGEHVFGMNGRHLGWFINEVLYTNDGARIGFTSETCPVPPGTEPSKTERRPVDEIQSKFQAPPTPKLSFQTADKDLESFLKDGSVPLFS
jgi:hypothetical protein